MRKNLGLLVSMVIGIFVFMGGAIYAVWNSNERREQICNAVVGLRTDIVEVLDDQQGRAQENAKKLGLDTEQLKKDYQTMRSKINDRSCP